MKDIYIQLQINTDSDIDSKLVWVVYDLTKTIYKVFKESEGIKAHNFRKEQQEKYGTTSNTSRKEI
jgi:hypothetical protein